MNAPILLLTSIFAIALYFIALIRCSELSKEVAALKLRVKELEGEREVAKRYKKAIRKAWEVLDRALEAGE